MSTQKILNFAAGPSKLPLSVIEKSQAAILNYNNSGQSILEINHRSFYLDELHNEILNLLQSIIHIPANYQLLLLPGGSTPQFTMIPNNFLSQEDSALYLLTGEWSERAYNAAKKYYPVESMLINNCFQFAQTTTPENLHAKYVHITSNETGSGVEWHRLPLLYKDIPLIADMSSNLLTRTLNLQDYGMIYASTQKNIGIAGLVLILIRDDLLAACQENAPDVFNYRLQLEKKSTLNTPSLFSWYVLKLMLSWIVEQGGLEALELQNIEKSKLLYEYIDQSVLYNNSVDPNCRSRVNIVFDLPDANLTTKFLLAAEEYGIINIKGRPSQSGVRVSLYNAISLESVRELIRFMEWFEQR